MRHVLERKRRTGLRATPLPEEAPHVSTSAITE
jgi:hypothetical protein